MSPNILCIIFNIVILNKFPTTFDSKIIRDVKNKLSMIGDI